MEIERSHILGVSAREAPLLLIALKRRWPILTTVAAGLLWLLNNYQIRGLDGLRLEPKSTTGYGSNGLDSLGNPPAGFPIGFPNSFSGGPSLPSSQLAPLWPNHNTGNAGINSGSNHAPGWPPNGTAGVGYAAGYPAGHASLPAGSENSLYVNQFPGAALPSSSLPGASLPNSSLPGTSLPGTSLPGTSLPATGNLNMDALRPAAKILLGQEWDQLLSVGEKLGMLEQARRPVQPVTPLPSLTPSGLSTASPVAARRGTSDTIRIASFNLNGWGDQTQDNLAATELIMRILAQFDVVALQDIRSRRDDLLPNLVERLSSSSGRRFDYMIGPRVGRGQQLGQLAFVFDTSVIETDRFQLYSVADPEDMLSREPLVGWFRARQVDSRDAFTFTLVNLHIDSDLAGQELAALPNLLEAIYSDGRGEDDIILAGDFSAAGQLSSRLAPSAFRILVEGVATTTRGTQLADNIVVPLASTTEFTGRSGVVDFLRQYNLTLEQATSVSEHLPIWGEFSIIEGGRPGQIAGNGASRSTGS